jgi:hypothetical protein
MKKETCYATLRHIFIRVYRQSRIKNLGGEGPQTDKHLPQSPFTGSFLTLLHFTLLSIRLIH